MSSLIPLDPGLAGQLAFLNSRDGSVDLNIYLPLVREAGLSCIDGDVVREMLGKILDHEQCESVMSRIAYYAGLLTASNLGTLSDHLPFDSGRVVLSFWVPDGWTEPEPETMH